MSKYILICLLLLITVNSYTIDKPFFSIEVKDKVNALAYYPLSIGNKWIYENEYKSAIGNSQKIITITWINEVSIVDHHDIPEGKVIIRRINNSDIKYVYPKDIGEKDISWFKENIPDKHVSHYLVKGNYIYNLPYWGWDAKRESLTDNYKKRMKEFAPEFFFPMTIGIRWSDRNREESDYKRAILWKQGKGGAPNPGMYYWIVEKKEDIEVPFGKINSAFSLIYPTLGGPSRLWFKEKIGIVKEQYHHGGSYFEKSSVLKEFIGRND